MTLQITTMKKQTFIILAAGLLLLPACTKPSSGSSHTSTGDTSFTGSYFNLSYSGNNESIKGYTVSTPYYASATVSTTSENLGSGYIYYQIIGVNSSNIGGLSESSLQFVYTGTGIGSYPIYTTVPSHFLSNSTGYSDTSGTVTITYSGSDYIQGTFSITLYGSGLSIPATGSFKVMH